VTNFARCVFCVKYFCPHFCPSKKEIFMAIKDRIREFRRIPAKLLQPNPRNWRTHPAQQQAALRGVLEEIGLAGALLARELPSGRYELLDGHLRAELLPEAEVPVLLLDLNDQEAALLLAVYDPLSSLAERDRGQLQRLLAEVEAAQPAVRTLLAELAAQAGAGMPQQPQDDSLVPPLPECFQVLADCRSESDQKDLFRRLTAEGYSCRVLTL